MRSTRSGAVAVCTLVHLRRHRDLPALLRQLRLVRREVATLDDPPLLMRTWWDPRRRTVTFLSVWTGPRSVLLFNGLTGHLDAVRWVLRGRHPTWTGVFRMAGVSDLSVRPDVGFWLDAMPPAQPGRPS